MARQSFSRPPGSALGGSQTANVLKDVSQAGHGFTVGALTPVRHSGAAWVKSQADSLADAAVSGIAVATDADTFDLYLPGSEIPTSGATAGAAWLDPATAGALTDTEPSAVGQVVKRLGDFISATEFLFAPDGPQQIVASPYMKQLVSGATALAVGDLPEGFWIPSDLDGFKIVSVELGVKVAPSGSAIEVGLKNEAGLEVFSTNPQVAVGERSSEQGSGVAAVVNEANATLATGDFLVPHGVTVDSGGAADGVTLLLRIG